MDESVEKEIEYIINSMIKDFDMKCFSDRFAINPSLEYKVKYLREYIKPCLSVPLFKYKVSEEFLREFSDNLDWSEWSTICRTQKLSEKFMRNFNEKLDWFNIFCYQEISDEFIKEFYEKLHRYVWYYTVGDGSNYIYKDGDINFSTAFKNEEIRRRLELIK